MSILFDKKFLIEGHRGVQSLYPGNTLPSFQAAIDLHVDCIELDLLAIEGGEIVIHHDYKVSERLIHSFTLPELKRAKIPLLKELFEMVQKSKSKICFNLEIKSDPKHPEYTLPLDVLSGKIVGFVREYGFVSRVYYSSFHPEALFAIKRADPGAVVALLYHNGAGKQWLKPVLDVCAQVSAQIVSPCESLLNAEIMHAFKQAKLRVIPWVVNDFPRFEELVAMGVDGIITDYPQDFLRKSRI